MMPLWRTSALVGGLLVLGAAAALGNPLPVWEDGEFQEGTWGHDVILDFGEGVGTVARETTGNPGACLLVTTEVSGSLWVVLWNEFGWDPAAGPVQSLMFQIDEKAVISSGTGQNLKALVVQNGRFFVAPLTPVDTGPGSDPEWKTVTFAALVESDFAEIPAWPDSPADPPDFSTAGEVLYFGFAVGGLNTPGMMVHLYDNWMVVPFFGPVAVEPESWGGVKGLYR